ncbi:MAG: carbon-nitrogen hydrolase family protein [Rickettsiales bacterium]
MQNVSVGLIQMTSGDDIVANIAQLAPMVASAAASGAQLIATPENTFYMRREGTAAMTDVPMVEHPGIVWARGAAKTHGVWLLIGSIRAREAGMERPYNRSVLIGPEGEIAASYDKLHLFDVTLPDGQHYAESSQAVAGAGAVVATTPFALVGLSICYDLRFPNLYRTLALRGAEILTVPSAFTRPTGTAHWHVLLRARAIENACYVLAPAQCGMHPGGRETFGHSVAVDPWGSIIAERTDDTPGVLMAALDATKLDAVRTQIPVLQHHRDII